MGAASQVAQGYASLGEPDEAKRWLDRAADLTDAANAGTPPGTAYWLTGTFQRLNLGIAYLALGEYRAATDHLRGGLNGLPPDQQGASWGQEYRDALTEASARS
jgi:hypothetical protein